MHSDRDLSSLLTLPAHPRSASYDPRWVMANVMGPNPLWLMESLTQQMELQPSMRVLDLGCGRAITSIFLAREFGVRVVAADLWVKPSENWSRVREAGVEDLVVPLHAEAHALPFADEYFDAILSVDAYHYFGTDDLYLSACARFLQRGGQIGIAVPGLVHELDEGLPPHLQRHWPPDFWTFHSPDWWRRLWDRSGEVEVERADMLPEGWREWALWTKVCIEEGIGDPADSELELVEADAGQNLGFTRVVARRLQNPASWSAPVPD